MKLRTFLNPIRQTFFYVTDMIFFIVGLSIFNMIIETAIGTSFLSYVPTIALYYSLGFIALVTVMSLVFKKYLLRHTSFLAFIINQLSPIPSLVGVWLACEAWPGKPFESYNFGALISGFLLTAPILFLLSNRLQKNGLADDDEVYFQGAFKIQKWLGLKVASGAAVSKLQVQFLQNLLKEIRKRCKNRISDSDYQNTIMRSDFELYERIKADLDCNDESLELRFEKLQGDYSRLEKILSPNIL